MISIHPPDHTAKQLLMSLHRREDMCDIAIVVGKDTVLAHSCILASQSTIIASILKARLENQCDWSSLMPLYIAFDDIVMDTSNTNAGKSDSKKVLELLVSFMYGQSITSSKSELESMIWYGKLLGISNELFDTLLVASNYSKQDLITEQIQDIFNKDINNDVDCFKMDNSLEAIEISTELCSDNILDKQIPLDENTQHLNMDSEIFTLDPETDPSKDILNVFATEDIYTSSSSFKEPLKFDAASSISGNNTLNTTTFKQPLKTTGKSHICNICQITFQKCCDLVKHVLAEQHFSLDCPVCLLKVNDNEGQRIHFAHHDHILPFFCPHCDLRFRTRAALTMHTPKHSNTKPYNCSECGRAFKWRHSLQAHTLTHKNHCHLLCEICGFSSNYAYTFKAHLQQHNGQEYPFQCPQTGCTFKSYRRNHLKNHLTSHSKVRPHQCEVCGRSFSQAKNLRRHMRLHALDTSLLECKSLSHLPCEFSTTRLDKLRNHLAKKHNLDSQGIKINPKDKASISNITHLSPPLPYIQLNNDIEKLSDNINFTIDESTTIDMNNSLI